MEYFVFNGSDTHNAHLRGILDANHLDNNTSHDELYNCNHRMHVL